MINYTTHIIKRLGMILVCLQLLGAPNVVAQTVSDSQVWAEAIAAYDQSQYAKAAELLSGLAKQAPPNGHIYYNLGNTYYRLGEKGKAMASYLEARRLLPRDPDVKANLQFVHEGLRDRLAMDTAKGALGVVAFWVGNTTPRELLLAAVTLWAIAFLLLAAALWIRRFKLAKVVGSGCLALAVVCFGAWAVSLSANHHWGAVTVEKAAVKSGPGAHNTVVFELHEGAPFVAEQQENGWYRITLADGKKGWIAGKEALVWGQPESPVARF